MSSFQVHGNEAAEALAIGRLVDAFRSSGSLARLDVRVACAAGEEGRVTLPPELANAVIAVLDATRHGDVAISVGPERSILTTTQAAELLGMSRPTLVKLLNEGVIPFVTVGRHRRIRSEDLDRFREERRVRQHAAVEAIAALGEDPEDLDGMRRDLKAVRSELWAHSRHS